VSSGSSISSRMNDIFPAVLVSYIGVIRDPRIGVV
jgi:hypothetical protein